MRRTNSNRQLVTERHQESNDYIRQIQIHYDESTRHIYENGTSLEILRRIKDLKRRLRNEYKALHQGVWNGLITNLDIDEDPTNFWKPIWQLNGNNKQQKKTYEATITKTYHPHDKERLFRTHWSKIFTSHDPEDNDFDYEHINSIEQIGTDNLDRIMTFNYGD